jgi:hypothetical protein
MMADWNDPLIDDPYADLLATFKARDEDAASHAESPTNPPIGYIRWVVSTSKFQRWSGAIWVDLVLAVGSGGTGGTSALGTLAFQSASAVAITGGTLTGVAITLGGNLSFDADGTRNIGSFATQAGKIYVKNACVIPVGPNKWETV